jgi:predicted branched-subunit amino acid permease
MHMLQAHNLLACIATAVLLVKACALQICFSLYTFFKTFNDWMRIAGARIMGDPAFTVTKYVIIALMLM